MATPMAGVRTGLRDGHVLEAARRRVLGLDLLDALWAGAKLDEDEAMAMTRCAWSNPNGRRHQRARCSGDLSKLCSAA
jgi:hypothetical protein